MRPEITLTDAERWALWDVAVDAFAPEPPPSKELLAVFVRAALAAVPRLALASPMVGELVTLVRDYDRAYCEVARDNESREAFYPGLTRHALQERLAALTGEEGRDG